MISKYKLHKWKKLIEKSGLFDKTYYHLTYPEIKSQITDPIEHYLKFGAKEGKNPSKNFDSLFYLSSYPDVKKTGINPLVHYILHGKKEQRLVSNNTKLADNTFPKDDDFEIWEQIIHDSNLFDEQYYLFNNPDIVQSGFKPIMHYIMHGAHEGRNPNRTFDTNFYLSSNPEIKPSQVNPLVHYIQHGKVEGKETQELSDELLNLLTFSDSLDVSKSIPKHWKIAIKESGLFDATYYLATYPDVKNAGVVPISHYLMHGIKEGRKPNRDFDPAWYSTFYERINKTNAYPLIFFILYGLEAEHFQNQNEKDTYHSLQQQYFDVSFYKKHHEGLKSINTSGIDLLLHYVRYGQFEHRQHRFRSKAENVLLRSGLFDVDYYLDNNPDIRLSGTHPIAHYLSLGANEGRDPNAFFNTSWYKSQYMADDNGNPLVHYILVGVQNDYNPTFLFDVKKYLKAHPDAKSLTMSPLKHALTHKNNQILRYDYGREDCKLIIDSHLFNDNWFTIHNPDLKGQDGLLHYCIHSNKEKRKPNPYFDTNWYKNQYSDELAKDENPLIHYITNWEKGFNPSAAFDTKKYLQAYPEVKASGINPLTHYLTQGIEKGYKTFEFHESIRIEKDASFSEELFSDLAELFDYKKTELAPKSKTYNPNALDIHFVIPDFGVGGGGHMNIFRKIRYLETYGHNFTIWIFRPSLHDTEESTYDDIIRHYSTLRAKVKFIDNTEDGDDSFENASGDVIIASSWDTVWPVQSAKYFKRRFYFIQDYEVLFHSKGSRTELAELTYHQDLDAICASTWLDKLMKEKYHKWSDYFNLAYEPDTFYPREMPKNDIPRIAFYARIFTERRAVELGILALEMLAAEGYKFHVDMYGAAFNFEKAPFSCNIYKTRTPEELAEIYNQSDIGVVFSLTNYSLVPQEMMACGLPVVEFDTESTRAIYPDDVVSFSGPSPEDIKDKIKILLDNPKLRKQQSQKALEWVNQFSWEKSSRKIESILQTRLAELGFDAKEAPQEMGIKASVVIPTYNGGELFKTVLDKIKNQKAPWQFEVIVLDSESSDGTSEFVQADTDVSYHKILKKDFNHGATRNYGASVAKGEFVAFITQDAIPLNDEWLYNMVTMLEHFPNAAGAFGKHIVHDDASFFTKQEMLAHFNGFDKLPLCVSKETEIPAGFTKDSWRGVLRFYSDNSSCFRKSVWEKIPYRPVQYGEDQIWGDDVIKAGYEKVYAMTSVVKHSHEYSPKDNYERAKIDGDYFKFFWGDKLVEESRLPHIIESFSRNTRAQGLENGIPSSVVEAHIASLASKFKGYVDGYNKPLSMFAEHSDEKSKF